MFCNRVFWNDNNAKLPTLQACDICKCKVVWCVLRVSSFKNSGEPFLHISNRIDQQKQEVFTTWIVEKTLLAAFPAPCLALMDGCKGSFSRDASSATSTKKVAGSLAVQSKGGMGRPADHSSHSTASAKRGQWNFMHDYFSSLKLFIVYLKIFSQDKVALIVWCEKRRLLIVSMK